MAKGVLIAAMDFSACPEDEFHDWYDLEHVPERLRVPGFLNAERWIDAENPKISVATYDLDTVGVLHSPPYLAIAGANSSPWTKRTQRFRKSLLRYEGEQILPGDATAPANAGGLLLVGMSPAARSRPRSTPGTTPSTSPRWLASPGCCPRAVTGPAAATRNTSRFTT